MYVLTNVVSTQIISGFRSQTLKSRGEKLLNISVIQFNFSQSEFVIWIMYQKISMESNPWFKLSRVLYNEFSPSSRKK
jgi:hypothetical protein